MTVDGMTCSHCVGRVTDALQKVDGVETVSVSLDDKAARIQGPDDFNTQAAITAVKEAGYEATVAV